jgi:hypothetical protein
MKQQSQNAANAAIRMLWERLQVEQLLLMGAMFGSVLIISINGLKIMEVAVFLF